MLDQILQVAVGTGLMATLFVALLAYVLQDARKREQKYQDVIDKLHDSIQKDVTAIKDKVCEK